MKRNSPQVYIALFALLGAGSCQNAGHTESLPAGVRTEPERRAGIESYSGVVDRVAHAVVTIRSQRRARAPQQFPFMDDPFFRHFFGDRYRPPGSGENRRQVERGLGSGVVVRADGHIVTNHHVVDGAEELRVEFADGKHFDASLLGSDAPSDLALLKIKQSGLNALKIGNSDAVRVGDVVLAVGNPLGIGQTVTQGIISAKGRTTGLSDGTFEDFLQTDAAINQGNSGGALVNTAGDLVGINSQILSPTGANIGIGFAIPSNMVMEVLKQLIDHGEVRRGQLGVTIQPLTPELSSALGINDGKGVVVAGVQAGGPAHAAGIRAGDVITAINSDTMESTNKLRNRISSLQPGTEISVTALRDGKAQQFKVKLGEYKVDPQGGPGYPRGRR